MIILSLDPGSEKTAFVLYDSHRTLDPISEKGILENAAMLARITDWAHCKVLGDDAPDVLAIEQVACYGMKVGKTIFDTVFWSGRFAQAWGETFVQIPRDAVKLKLCGMRGARIKDKHIRAALIEKFGGKAKAIGNKKSPGALFGCATHNWSALAVAVCHIENQPYQ
jgi:hypothetical protein